AVAAAPTVLRTPVTVLTVTEHVPPPQPDGDAPAAVRLTTPRDVTPEPVTTPEQLRDVIRRFAAGTGPIAVDAERASGYRYTHRAYLVQLRREGAGTALIDPIPFGDL